MGIAIYVRVSTDAQAEQGTSLDTQVEACQKKGIELGYDMSKAVIYRDEGESGADIDRPALNSLRADVETGIISNTIICYDPDRLSRKLNYQLILEEEFKIAGVKLLFVNSDNKRETPEGMLLFHMQGAVAEYERTKIKERTIRGKLAKARQGQIMPMRTTPYGYTWIDGKLEINEDEIEIVRNVFKWYIEGFTMREIGEKLSYNGFEARYGNWNASTIRNIINNETYIGHYWYNRRKQEKLPTKTKSGNHSTRGKLRPESDHILIEVPSIIDEAIWKKAQARKVKNTIYSKRNTKLEYLARGGFLKCFDCGRVLQNTSYNYKSKSGGKEKVGIYRCPNLSPRSYGTEKCPSSSIKSRQLDEFIWSDIIEEFLNPTSKELIEFEDENIDTEKERKNLQLQQEKVKVEKEKILNLYRKELISMEDVEQQLESIKKKEQLIVEQLNILNQEEENSNTLTEEEKQEIINEIKPFLLNDEIDFEDKQIVFKTLVTSIRIKLRPGVVDLYYDGVITRHKTHFYKPRYKPKEIHSI